MSRKSRAALKATVWLLIVVIGMCVMFSVIVLIDKYFGILGVAVSGAVAITALLWAAMYEDELIKTKDRDS